MNKTLAALSFWALPFLSQAQTTDSIPRPPVVQSPAPVYRDTFFLVSVPVRPHTHEVLPLPVPNAPIKPLEPPSHLSILEWIKRLNWTQKSVAAE